MWGVNKIVEKNFQFFLISQIESNSSWEGDPRIIRGGVLIFPEKNKITPWLKH